MIIKNKKGSHIGIVLSFTLFVTSIIFLYNIIESPIENVEDTAENLDFIKTNFINSVTEEIIIVRIAPSPTCVVFQTPSITFSNPQIYSASQEETPSGLVGASSEVIVNGNFTKAYFSNSSFDKTQTYSAGGCDPVTPFSITNERYITQNKIEEIINISINNETLFKNAMKISDDYDFSIIFEFSNSSEIGKDPLEDRNLKSNIYSREYLINYLDRNAEMTSGKLKIKIW